MQEYTEDSILRRDLRIVQSVRGYRFSVDAILLAHFISCEPTDKVLEVGAGSGVVTILLSALREFRFATAVEIQSDLANLCKLNFESNGISNAEVCQGDIKVLAQKLRPNSFDVIYSNPPYRKTGSGKLNASPEKAIARHELKLNLEDLFDCSRLLLKPNGRLVTILPAYREKDLHRLAEKFQMHILERRYVHSFENDPPAFFLTAVSSVPSSVVEHPGIVIYQTPGIYTDQMNQLLNL